MARKFVAADTQRIDSASGGVYTAPLTMSCWFKTPNINVFTRLLITENHTTGSDFFLLQVFNDNKIEFTAWRDATQGPAKTTTTISANTWYHVCGVATSATRRDVFLNGSGQGTSTTNVTPQGLEESFIGAMWYDYVGANTYIYSNVTIAEVGIWNTAITASNVLQLAAGYSPLLIRPESLVNYWPLIGRTSPEIELSQGHSGVLVNGPTVDAHPRIIYPSSPQVGLHFTAASAASPYMTTSPGLWGPL